MTSSDSKIRSWIEDIAKTPFPSDDIFESLVDGVVLCKFIAKIRGKFVSFNRSPAKDSDETENFATFCETVVSLGYKAPISFSHQSLKNKSGKDALYTFFKDFSVWLKNDGKFKGAYLEDMKGSIPELKSFEKKDSFTSPLKKKESMGQITGTAPLKSSFNDELAKKLAPKHLLTEEVSPRSNISPRDEKRNSKVEKSPMEVKKAFFDKVGPDLRSGEGKLPVGGTPPKSVKPLTKEEEQDVKSLYQKEMQRVRDEAAQFKASELLKFEDFMKGKKFKEEAKITQELQVYKQKLLAQAEMAKAQRVDELRKAAEVEFKLKMEKNEVVFNKDVMEKESEKRKLELEQLENEKLMLNEKCEQLVSQMSTIRKDQEKKIAELKRQKDFEIENIRDDAKHSHANEIAKIKTELQLAKTMNLTLEKQVAELNEKLEENDGSFEVAIPVEDDSKDDVINTLETKVKDLELQVLQRKSSPVKRESIKVDTEELDRLKNENSRLSTQLHLLQGEHQILQRHVEEQQETINDLRQKDSERAEYIQDLQHQDQILLQAEIEKRELLERVAKEDNERLEREIQEMHSKQDELEQEMMEREKRWSETVPDKTVHEKRQSTQDDGDLMVKLYKAEKQLADTKTQYDAQVKGLMTDVKRLEITRDQLLKLITMTAEKRTIRTGPPPPPTLKPLPKLPPGTPSKGEAHKIFGVELYDVIKRKEQEGNKIPKEIMSLLMHVDKYACQDEGIFRIPGEGIIVNEYKERMDNGKFVLDEKDKNYPVLASIIKCYLRELPNPLMTFDNYDKFLKFADIEDHDAKLAEFKASIKGLPESYGFLVEILLKLLAKIASFANVNKMHVNNISIVFGMNLMRPRNENPLNVLKDCKKVNDICSFLIENVDELYN